VLQKSVCEYFDEGGQLELLVAEKKNPENARSLTASGGENNTCLLSQVTSFGSRWNTEYIMLFRQFAAVNADWSRGMWRCVVEPL